MPLLRIAGAVCCAVSGLDPLMVNRTLALGRSSAPSDAELDEIDTSFREAGVPAAEPLPPD